MRLECEIVFDGIPSSEFDIKVFSLGEAPDSETIVEDKEITKVKAPCSSKYKILNVAEKDPLKFKMQLLPAKNRYLSSENLEAISEWLFNKTDYKKLQIIEEDISHIYYNCILTNATKLMAAQNIIGIEFTVECDSNGAWEFERTINYDYSTSGSGTFVFNNKSADINGLNPRIIIEMFEDGIFSMTNNTTGQITTINSLNIEEIITLDCEHQIITSNLNRYLFDIFNSEFPHFKRGLNSITISGRCKITIQYQNQVKVGG